MSEATQSRLFGKDSFTIGELARLYGVGVDTLRYYEEKGLIEPARGANGYRYYGPESIWRMNVIRNLRSLGFSADSIRDYLANRTVARTEALLYEELRNIDEKLRELQLLRKTVKEQINIIETSSRLATEEVRVLELAPRRVFAIEQSYDHEEDMDLLMKRLVEQNGGKIFIIGNNRIASVIDEAGETPSFKGAVMFDEGGTATLPGGTYLSVCYRGAWNSHHYLGVLREYAAERGLTLVPPFMDLVWIDIHTSADESEHFSEVQALVRPAEG